jgi:hypothetical protein
MAVQVDRVDQAMLIVAAEAEDLPVAHIATGLPVAAVAISAPPAAVAEVEQAARLRRFLQLLLLLATAHRAV